jgi:16S rRNA (uracil1498-N3)-methyltransferase
MARRRFFVDEVRHGLAVLAGDDGRHLRQVLRAEPGQLYEISDNHSVYLAEIEAVRKDEISFRVIETLAVEEPPLRLTLFLALIKFERFEWALERGTELGVEAVVPVEAERSEKGLERAALKRVERWRRIVRESSQQARRARMPEVGGAVPLEEALETPAACRYFLDEDGGRPLLAAAPAGRARGDRVALAVGPEGGWTDAESQLARERGWTCATLGPTILRTETAAIAATAVLVNAWLVD